MPMLGWNGPQIDSDGGICTLCGKEVKQLTIVDEETHVCDECLNSNYTQCDECGEYYLNDSVEMYELEDGRCICEYCYAELSDEDE